MTEFVPGEGLPTGERLQKFIGRCGVASRREAETLIHEGRVEVNGRVVTEMGTRVDPTRDIVRIDGERVRAKSHRTVLVLNKPVGVLCSVSDPQKRPLVYALVPKGEGLRTVGRLDFNTEGVLLLTNDGDLAERLGHARYSVQRVYEARVRGVPSDATLAQLVRGVRLEDGPARAEAAELVTATDANAWLRLVLTEGRNREVRRLLERVGHPVVRLRRVAFAGLTIAGLKPGQWRVLAADEVAQLEARGHVGPFDLPPDPRRKPARTRAGSGRKPSRPPPPPKRLRR
jgi:23S rRNA pseudouridine2605 synthase